MFTKSFIPAIAAVLVIPALAFSGVAYAGGPRTPTAYQNSVQALNQSGQSLTSKPYAQYVAPTTKTHWTGPKQSQFHTQRY